MGFKSKQELKQEFEDMGSIDEVSLAGRIGVRPSTLSGLRKKRWVNPEVIGRNRSVVLYSPDDAVRAVAALALRTQETAPVVREALLSPTVVDRNLKIIGDWWDKREERISVMRSKGK